MKRTTFYSEPTDVHPDADALFEQAVHRGARLAGTVRNLAAWDVAQITDPLTRDQLVATIVALACMVPDDQTPAALLAWHEPIKAPAKRVPVAAVAPIARRGRRVCEDCGALTATHDCDVCAALRARPDVAVA